MVSVSSLSLNFGGRKLFEDVNLQFTEGCYGIIGANGTGKSTFLKILAGEIVPSVGSVHIPSDYRLSVLRQDHFAFDEYKAIDCVFMGHKKLYAIMDERNKLYAKEEFSDDDGIRVAEIETEFSEMGGWEAEADAAILLKGLGISETLLEKQLKELEPEEKVKILLAQALFGSPELLILDEPTNHLEHQAVNWLADFLRNYPKTVIVVSHDRHFLNKVCDYTVDIDYQKMTLYAGNYDFWKQTSEIQQKLMEDSNKKKEEKAEELKRFIERFGAQAARAGQAASKKKMLEKINFDEIRPSSRKYPYISFEPKREPGKDVLNMDKINKTIDGKKILSQFSLEVLGGDRIAFLGKSTTISTLFDIISGVQQADSGTFTWGQTITSDYFPVDNTRFFSDGSLNLVDWLRQYSEDKTESFIRGFLGRMLFSGEETQKSVKVLSGGEKVRCMFSKIMLARPNALILDGPTNHLDLESISALNDGLKKYTYPLFFSTHDYEIIDSVANRIVEITPNGFVDKRMSYGEYLSDKPLQEKLAQMRKE